MYINVPLILTDNSGSAEAKGHTKNIGISKAIVLRGQGFTSDIVIKKYNMEPLSGYFNKNSNLLLYINAHGGKMKEGIRLLVIVGIILIVLRVSSFAQESTILES